MKSCVLIKRKLTKALGQFPEIDQGKEVDQGPWSISRIHGLMCILIRSKPPSFQSPQCTRHGKTFDTRISGFSSEVDLGLLLDEFTCRLKSGVSLLTVY